MKKKTKTAGKKAYQKKQSKAKRKYKRSKIVNVQGQQKLIYHPTARHDVFPSEMFMTHYYQTSVLLPATNIGTGNPYYFTVRGSNINIPINASGNGGAGFYQKYSGVNAGVGSLTQGYTDNDNVSGWQRLGAIYKGYQVIGSEIQITPSFLSATDSMKLYCYPYISQQQNINTSAVIPVQSSQLDEVKGLNSGVFRLNMGGTKSVASLKNKALSHVVHGYSGIREFLSDFTGNGWSIIDANSLPPNAWNWIILYTMADGASNAGAMTLDIQVKYRVRWSQLVQFA